MDRFGAPGAVDEKACACSVCSAGAGLLADLLECDAPSALEVPLRGYESDGARVISKRSPGISKRSPGNEWGSGQSHTILQAILLWEYMLRTCAAVIWHAYYCLSYSGLSS